MEQPKMNEKQIETSSITARIDVEGRVLPYSLDFDTWRWHSSEEQKEADFPLITVVNSKRYELYSDETFAEVEN
jgi:hypothetical protein